MSRHWFYFLTGGVYGITSSFTLDTTFDTVSDKLQDVALSESLWQPGDGEINFQQVFCDGGDKSRLLSGMKLLEEKSGKMTHCGDVHSVHQD